METVTEYNYPSPSYNDLLIPAESIQDLSEEEKQEIDANFELAYNFSRQAHNNQKRKSGEDYIVHPRRALLKSLEELSKCIPQDYITVFMCAVILHDVIEDTKTTKQDIVNIFPDLDFGNDVATVVDYISKDPTVEECKHKQYGKKLKKISSISGNGEKTSLERGRDNILKILALVAKAGDSGDNLETLDPFTPEKIRRIIDKTRDNVLTLYHAVYHSQIIDSINKSLELAEKIYSEKKEKKAA